MLRVQLSTGKTITMTLEKYLEMTEEGMQELVAKDAGYFVEDPFEDTSLLKYEKKLDKKELKIPDLDIQELTQEEIEQIIKDMEKGE